MTVSLSNASSIIEMPKIQNTSALSASLKSLMQKVSETIRPIFHSSTYSHMFNSSKHALISSTRFLTAHPIAVSLTVIGILAAIILTKVALQRECACIFMRGKA